MGSVGISRKKHTPITLRFLTVIITNLVSRAFCFSLAVRLLMGLTKKVLSRRLICKKRQVLGTRLSSSDIPAMVKSALIELRSCSILVCTLLLI